MSEHFIILGLAISGALVIAVCLTELWHKHLSKQPDNGERWYRISESELAQMKKARYFFFRLLALWLLIIFAVGGYVWLSHL